jgi:hypothetical protein
MSISQSRRSSNARQSKRPVDARNRGSCRIRIARKRMVGLGRLELPTSRLSSARSNQLSYRPGPHPRHYPGIRLSIGKPAGTAPGGAERVRTVDPLLAKQVLSQLSYSPGPLVHRSSTPHESPYGARVRRVNVIRLTDATEGMRRRRRTDIGWFL